MFREAVDPAETVRCTSEERTDNEAKRSRSAKRWLRRVSRERLTGGLLTGNTELIPILNQSTTFVGVVVTLRCYRAHVAPPAAKLSEPPLNLFRSRPASGYPLAGAFPAASASYLI